jgi:hypothetical protein
MVKKMGSISASSKQGFAFKMGTCQLEKSSALPWLLLLSCDGDHAKALYFVESTIVVAFSKASASENPDVM